MIVVRKRLTAIFLLLLPLAITGAQTAQIITAIAEVSDQIATC
jgi:hypothetical protein